MRRKRVERVTKSSSGIKKFNILIVFEKVKTPISRNKQKEAVPKIKKTESAKLRSSLTVSILILKINNSNYRKQIQLHQSLQRKNLLIILDQNQLLNQFQNH